MAPLSQGLEPPANPGRFMRYQKLEASGGETGIRTLETLSGLHAFQACAFDRSATSPRDCVLHKLRQLCKGRRRGVTLRRRWSAPGRPPTGCRGRACLRTRAAAGTVGLRSPVSGSAKRSRPASCAIAASVWGWARGAPGARRARAASSTTAITSASLPGSRRVHTTSEGPKARAICAPSAATGAPGLASCRCPGRPVPAVDAAVERRPQAARGAASERRPRAPGQSGRSPRGRT